MMKFLNKRILGSLCVIMAITVVNLIPASDFNKIPAVQYYSQAQSFLSQKQEQLSSLFKDQVANTISTYEDVISGFNILKSSLVSKLSVSTQLAQTSQPLTQATQFVSTSIDTTSLRTDLQKELEAYINTRLTTNNQQPTTVTIYQSGPTINPIVLREQILTGDTRPVVTRQSNADADRRSVIASSITTNGTLTNPTISGATITTSTFSGTTGSFTDLTVSGTCTGCGASFPFTVESYGVSTSTTLGLTGGFLSTASSTFTSGLSFATATGTSATTTNLFSTTASSTNLFSSLLTVGGNALVVDSSRNVGIGTAVPGSWSDSTSPNLDIYNSGATRVALNLISDPAASGDVIGLINFLDEDSTNTNKRGARILGMRGANVNSAWLRFDTADSADGTARMVIDQSGKVGIGDTTPDAWLDVVMTADLGVAVGRFESTTSNAKGLEVFGNGWDGDLLDFQDSDGRCLLNPESASLASQCSSDERLKSNIVESPDQLGYLTGIPIKQYTVKASGETTIGTVAQELLSISDYEDMVSMGSDGFYTVREVSSWKIIKGIQELNLNLESIVSTTVSTSPLAASFAASFFENLFNRITTWLADAANGIENIFAKFIHSDTVYTKTICVGEPGTETCLTQAQLNTLLSNVSTVTITETVGNSQPATNEPQQTTDTTIATTTTEEIATTTEPVIQEEPIAEGPITETAAVEETAAEEPATESASEPAPEPAPSGEPVTEPSS